MTHEEKIRYMGIAAGVVGYKFEPKGLDLMISLYELVIEKQGETDLRSISQIETEVKLRDGYKKKTELLDKVSTEYKETDTE